LSPAPQGPVLRVVLFEGVGSRPIVPADRYVILSTLLQAGYAVTRVRRADVTTIGQMQSILFGTSKQARETHQAIAHLKATLTSPDVSDELAVVQAAGNDTAPEASYRFDAPIASGELVVNLRAEGDPALLQAVTRESLTEEAQQAGLTATVTHEEHFRPSRPVPTHRLVMS